MQVSTYSRGVRPSADRKLMVLSLLEAIETSTSPCCFLMLPSARSSKCIATDHGMSVRHCSQSNNFHRSACSEAWLQRRRYSWLIKKPCCSQVTCMHQYGGLHKAEALPKNICRKSSSLCAYRGPSQPAEYWCGNIVARYSPQNHSTGEHKRAQRRCCSC